MAILGAPWQGDWRAVHRPIRPLLEALNEIEWLTTCASDVEDGAGGQASIDLAIRRANLPEFVNLLNDLESKDFGFINCVLNWYWEVVTSCDFTEWPDLVMFSLKWMPEGHEWTQNDFARVAAWVRQWREEN
jgi:hypothetical protein